MKLLELGTRFDILSFTAALPSAFLGSTAGGREFLQEHGYWRMLQIREAFWRRKRASAFRLWRVSGACVPPLLSMCGDVVASDANSFIVHACAENC